MRGSIAGLMNKEDLGEAVASSQKPELGVVIGAMELPRSAFQAWPEIADTLRAAQECALLLDFDGTLVNLQRRPGDVKVSAGVKAILRRIIRHPNVFVAIVSGRRVRDLRRLLGLKGLHYSGLHGAEWNSTVISMDRRPKRTIDNAREMAQERLGRYKGIWIENKSLTFAVHHRSANASSVRAAKNQLIALLSELDSDLRILTGSCVWEVAPPAVPGKLSAIEKIAHSLKGGTAIVCVGDDPTDEPGFGALRNQITVRVGKRARTNARYYVRTPAELLHFLQRLEGEIPQ
jgi:trehalose 6-phosphate phosphatase